ncbi:S-layer homology domain-containing protein [Fictibacillus aquaticus]|uniref:SLH domain-containing protein n=1 Tax=Fictibacillus aquaticus TaxID=2021314 RepID=A0A235F9P4_9BACL|nr:S-layer homology domain-containing protein [Fictibacillus aquaticus]OYD57743.1 hypothetical protein CGZ90_13875 [Fictibacillus aquaticus]
MGISKFNRKLIHTTIVLSLAGVPAVSGITLNAPAVYAETQTTSVDALINEMAVYYSFLNDTEKAELKAVQANIANLTAQDIETILTPAVMAKVDSKAGAGTAANAAKDAVAIFASTTSAQFKKAVIAYRAKYSKAFDQVFGEEVTVDYMIEFLAEYRSQLKDIVLKDATAAKTKTLEEVSVQALNNTLAVDRFKTLDGKLTSGLGIGITELFNKKKQLEAKVDPEMNVQKVLISGVVRAKEAKIYGSGTAELNAEAPSYMFKLMLDGKEEELTEFVKWTTDNSEIANMVGTKLNVKKPGNVNVQAKMFGIVVLEKYVTITAPVVDTDTVVVPIQPPVIEPIPGGGSNINITLDTEGIQEALTNDPNAEILTISYEPTDNAKDALLVDLSPEVLALVEDKTIKVDFGQVSYSIPVNELGLDKLGEGVTISINIAPGKDADKIIEKNKFKQLTKIYDFSLVATDKDGKTTEIKNFNSYVEREIEGDAGFKINNTAAVRLNADGTFSPIPALLHGDEATLKSRTNSLYTMVYNNKSFTDLKTLTAPHAAEVRKLANKLILMGNNGKFMPQTGTTRSDLVVFIVRGLGLDTSKKYDGRFVDVKGQPHFAEEMMAAIDAGIVYGTADKKFNPKKFVTRQEAAAMIARAMAFTTYDASKLDKKKTLKIYKDRGHIGNWAKKDVELLLQSGIMLGDRKGNFNPAAVNTRAQMASMMHRFMKFVDLMN